MPNNLAINIELLRDSNHLISGLFVGVNLQTMAHVEDLVHLVPISARSGLDHLEQGRQRQHVVLHDVQLVNEMQHLGLGAATADPRSGLGLAPGYSAVELLQSA